MPLAARAAGWLVCIDRRTGALTPFGARAVGNRPTAVQSIGLD